MSVDRVFSTLGPAWHPEARCSSDISTALYPDDQLTASQLSSLDMLHSSQTSFSLIFCLHTSHSTFPQMAEHRVWFDCKKQSFKKDQIDCKFWLKKETAEWIVLWISRPGGTVLSDYHHNNTELSIRWCVWKVGEGFLGRVVTKTLKWVVVYSSVTFHINVSVTGWGVMSCVCSMAFLCGSTLVKVPLLQAGTVAVWP